MLVLETLASRRPGKRKGNAEILSGLGEAVCACVYVYLSVGTGN